MAELENTTPCKRMKIQLQNKTALQKENRGQHRQPSITRGAPTWNFGSWGSCWESWAQESMKSLPKSRLTAHLKPVRAEVPGEVWGLASLYVCPSVPPSWGASASTRTDPRWFLLESSFWPQPLSQKLLLYHSPPSGFPLLWPFKPAPSVGHVRW